MLAEKLLRLAQKVVSRHPDFFETKGPGRGDRATNAFMADLRAKALKEFGTDYAEKEICGTNGFSVDYYFPSEATVVEVALGLSKPNTEFEKDVLKAIMAKEAGNTVSRLFFISKPGARKKCSHPGRLAIIEWLQRNHRISVEIHELKSVKSRQRRSDRR
jgi:hypothetical protein